MEMVWAILQILGLAVLAFVVFHLVMIGFILLIAKEQGFFSDESGSVP